MTTKPRVVYPDASADVERLLESEQGKRLRARADVRVHQGRPKDIDEYLDRTAGAAGMLLGWELPTDVLLALDRLEIISFTGIGVGNFVDLGVAAARGVTVTNTPGYADNTVAEHTMALMLAAVRHICVQDRELRRGTWDQSRPGLELRGKTLGLIGFGGIGARVAELARAFGMVVKAWTRSPDRERAQRHGVEFVPLDELLSSCDVLSIHVALAPETRGLLDGAAVARMHPGVVVINTARAQIMDEAAFLAALRNGHIAGAGLDVFWQEPLGDGHPLLELDNVVVSPHVAYHTPEASQMLMDIAVDNLMAYFDGRPCNVVAAPDRRNS